MLLYAGRGSRPGKPVELSGLVEDTLELARASCAPGCALDASLAPGVWVDGDATQLRQVVLNLVQNASESGGGGPVRVAIRTSLAAVGAAELADAHGGGDAVPGSYAALEVEDDGEGIDAETARRIFDPFFTTKRSGRGLGLAAVLGIVRGHRGAVALRSAPGRGSCFRVLIPAAEGAQLGAPPPPPAAAPRGAPPAPRVLVADDDEAVLELARELLTRAGYEVATAVGGRAAIARFAEAPAAVDVAVVDVAMPDVGGEQVVRALRARRPELPVVLSSGYAAADASERFASLGATRLLGKPWAPEALEAAVREALGAAAPPDSGR